MKILGLILLITFMVSCGQSPKSISKSVNNKFYISKNSKSCKQVNLYRDILTKENLINLFKCLDYENKYPEIYNAIDSAKPQSFDALNETLNRTYLKTTDTRNLLFGLIVSKTKKESSKSLSHLVKSFLKDTRNIVALKEMTNSLKTQKTKVSVDFLFSYLQFMADLGQETEIHRKKLETSFREPKTKQDFSEFLEVFFTNILIDNGPEKEAFISFLGNGKWLDSLLDEIDSDSFNKITNFVSTNKDFQNGIYSYQEAIETDSYNCSENSNSYVVDHSVELKWQLENLYYLDQADFELEMINLMTRFNLYSQICYNDKFIPSTQKLLSKFVNFIQIDGGFTILKNFAKLSVSGDFDYKTIINFFTSDSFNKLKLVLDSLRDDAQFNESVFKLMRSLSTKDILNVSAILDTLNKDPAFLESLSIIWNKELSSATKDMLIGYVVDMFLTSENIYPAFDFLNVVVSNMPSESEILFDDIIFDTNNDLQKLLSTLVNDTKLHLEVINFLDDNSLFELLSIIQKSNPMPVDTSETIVLEETLAQSSKEEGSGCLYYLSNLDPSNTLEDLVNKYPETCLGLENKDENFALKIIRWSKYINADFLDSFNNSFTSVKGILYKDTMHFLHQMVHVTTKYVNSAEDFSKATVNTVKDFFFKEKHIEQLEQGLVKLIEFEKSDKTISKVLDNTVKTSPKNFDEALKMLFKTMNDYTSSNETYKCLNVESCNFSVRELSSELNKNNLKFNREVLSNLFMNLSDGLYTPEDYIELIRFIGEENAYKAVALEKILKAVDFSNGYYSAFFISKLSRSKNYREAVKELKNDFKLAKKLSGTFKFLKLFPTDIKKRFNIVMSNIDVLDDFDKIIPGTSHKYGDVLIQLAKTLTSMSPRRGQNLVKISIPRRKKVYGHYSHYLLAMSKKGYLSEISNYLSQNLDVVTSSSLDFSLINDLFNSINLKANIDTFKLNKLPINKKMIFNLINTSNSVQKTLITYLKTMPLISIPSINKKMDLNKYRTLFKILSDDDVDYVSLHSSITRVHTTNPDYINQLLEYSMIENNNKSNIKLALENMFIHSNDSLILFFKDILAHFRLK